MEQSVTQCRELTAPFFAVSLSRNFMVHTSLYFYLRTPLCVPILRNAHSVTLYADRLHRIPLKLDNKCSKSAHAAQDFIYAPNYTTASVRRFWQTHDHSKFSGAYPVPNFIESRRWLWKIREFFVCSRNFKHFKHYSIVTKFTNARWHYMAIAYTEFNKNRSRRVEGTGSKSRTCPRNSLFLHNFLYLHTYLLHGAGSFLRS